MNLYGAIILVSLLKICYFLKDFYQYFFILGKPQDQ